MVQSLRTLLMLFCALLVTAQAGGVHLHYCPDGAGRTVSLHGPDWQPHECVDSAGHGLAAPHSDQVFFFASEVPVKKLDGQFDLPDPVWVTAPVFAAAATAPAVAVPAVFSHVPSPRWYSLQPPARGPPR